MHWFIYPQQDATIYRSQPNQNSGLDEILEITKTFFSDTTRELSRALIKFDITTVSQSIEAGVISDVPKFFLNIKISEASEIPFSYNIQAHPVSQSWEMGIGTRFDDLTTDGVSWNYKVSAADPTSIWTPSASGSTTSYATGTTGSMGGVGGNWYTGSGYEASQSFQYDSGDVRMDVTDIIHKWLSGSIENHGFILKYPTPNEDDTIDYGSLKFFSMDTNTVYLPTLEIVWNDVSYTTSSLQELTSEANDIVLYMRGFRDEYKEGSKIKFRVIGRERYPEKIFSAQSQYSQVKYIPTGSLFYSIVDGNSHDVVIPYSEYTRLSVDEYGNYFVLWTDGLQPERFYKIEYKLQQDAQVYYFTDKSFVFKLTR